MNAFSRSMVVVGLVGVGLLGGAGAASATEAPVVVNAGNAAPDTSGSAGPYCVGFDSTEGNELAYVNNPLGTGRLAAVGGLYVNTVDNCMG